MRDITFLALCVIVYLPLGAPQSTDAVPHGGKGAGPSGENRGNPARATFAAADSAPGGATTQPETLTGSDLGTAAATQGSDVIVVGTVTAVLIMSPTAMGVVDYAVAVSVQQVLKGADLPGELLLRVRTGSKRRELAPTEKGSYVFFLRSLAEKQYEVIKVIPASEPNVAEVKKAIAGLSTTQKDG